MKIKNFWCAHNKILIAIIFTIWGMILRFLHLAKRDLWLDEICTLNSLTGQVKPFWENTTYRAQLSAFPGEYIILQPFVQIFGHNKWEIMIPHITATFISFYFLYLICQKYLKSPLSYAIVFALFCFNPELIFHGFEFRAYAVLPTLTLASFYFSEMILCQPKKLSLLKKFLIGTLFIFITVYHPYGILILFFPIIFFLLIELTKRSLKEIIQRIWKFLSIFTLLAIPLFYWYLSGSTASGGSRGSDTFQFIPHPFQNPVGFLKGIFCNMTGEPKLYFLILGIPISFLIPQKNKLIHTCFFIILIIAPITLLLLTDISKRYWFLQRQFIWVTPLFIFLIGWCWDVIFEWVGTRQASRN